MSTTSRMSREDFCIYLRDTLIPDLRDSGSDATADDFERALDLIEDPDLDEVK